MVHFRSPNLMIDLILIALLLSACSTPPAMPTPMLSTGTTSPVPPTAAPTSIPPTDTPTPTATPTPTPVPAVTATAEAFRAAIQATAVAAQPTLAAIRSQLGAATRCQDIPADQLKLTSPVLLPAEVGEAWDGQATIFLVPPGTVVRAPIDGSIRLGPWLITPDIDYMTIAREDAEILVGFPRGGYEVLLPGYDPNKYFRGTDVKRGDPIARLNGSTLQTQPGGTVGLDAFNVIIEMQTPQQRFPPYGGGEPIPVGLSSNHWYGGFPMACQDWPAEPIPAAVVQATPTSMPTMPAVATPPPYAATIPTPTGRIAFFAELGDHSTEIFVFDLAEGTLQQVTHGEWVLSWRSFLGWHPDGQHLFFYTSEPERENRKVVLIDPVTGEAEILANFPTSGAVWMAWSLDGSRLAWATGKALYVADSSNTNPQQIFQAGNDVTEVIWSPDSQQIGFVVSNEVYLISPDGGDTRKITSFSAEPPVPSPFSLENLAWSPDGTRIAFIARSEADSSIHFCTLGLVEHIVTCLDQLPVSIWGAFAWLPDSQHVVFQAFPDIYALGVQNGEVLNLTHHPAWDRIPYHAADESLSPDGEFLVFTSDRDHYLGEVYVLHIPSGEVVARLTADFVRQFDAVWSPR